MHAANKKWSEWKWFNVFPVTNYLLGPITYKILITTEHKSRFSNVTLPDSSELSVSET
jgi:hypothetical protein